MSTLDIAINWYLHYNNEFHHFCSSDAQDTVGLAGQWASTIPKYSIHSFHSTPSRMETTLAALYHFPHSCRMDKSHTEPQHQLGWKRSLRSSPTYDWRPPHQLDHDSKSHVHNFFKDLQGWWLHYLPGLPTAVSNHHFCEEFLPNAIIP